MTDEWKAELALKLRKSRRLNRERRAEATSSTADPSGDQRAASQSTQFSDLDLKEGGLEVKEISPYDDSSNFLAGEKAIRKKANELMMTSL